MILYWFIPKLAEPGAAMGFALRRLAYPLDWRTPEQLARLVKRLETR